MYFIMTDGGRGWGPEHEDGLNSTLTTCDTADTIRILHHYITLQT